MRESRRIVLGYLSGHQDFLIGDIKGRAPLRDEGELELVNDPVDQGEAGEESGELHRAARAFFALKIQVGAEARTPLTDPKSRPG
jgi:hypothetical protein